MSASEPLSHEDIENFRASVMVTDILPPGSFHHRLLATIDALRAERDAAVSRYEALRRGNLTVAVEMLRDVPPSGTEFG